MPRLMICLMMLSVSACSGTPASGPAICDATKASRADLAGALLTDGGPQSRRAGLLVLDQMQAGCAG